VSRRISCVKIPQCEAKQTQFVPLEGKPEKKAGLGPSVQVVLVTVHGVYCKKICPGARREAIGGEHNDEGLKELELHHMTTIIDGL